MGKATESTYHIVKKQWPTQINRPCQKARIEARHGVYDLGTPLTKPGVW
jgi:hypothetical protein